MFSLQTIDFRRAATALVGTLILSTTCVGAAVGPARAATFSAQTASGWQRQVESQVERRLGADRMLITMGSEGAANVNLRFDADGRFQDASLARSTGSKRTDAYALKLARTLDYPVLPAALRGKQATVKLALFFSNEEGPHSVAQRNAQLDAKAIDAEFNARVMTAEAAAQPNG